MAHEKRIAQLTNLLSIKNVIEDRRIEKTSTVNAFMS